MEVCILSECLSKCIWKVPRVCPTTVEEKHYYKHGHIFSKFSLEDIVDMAIKLKIGDHNNCIKND